MVLLHGLTLTADVNWFPAYLPLGRYFHVLAFDQRGHGRGLTAPEIRLEDCADDVAALIAALDLLDVVAVGYSMGGAIAQELGRRHPDALAGMVLCATAAAFRAPFPTLGSLTPPAWAAWSLEAWRLASWWVPPPAAIDALRCALIGPIDTPLRRWLQAEQAHTDVASILSAALATARFRSTAWIAGLRLPTSVVVPAADRLVPVGHQLALAEAIPGADIFMTAGGHNTALNHPETFVPTLIDACRNVAGRLHPRLAPPSAGDPPE